MYELNENKLKRYGYAPGNYMVRCGECKELGFNLDKLASTCKCCAENLYNIELEEQEFYNIFPN